MKKEIVYHYFYDFDIEYLSEINEDPYERMNNFIKINFYYI